MFFLTWMPQGRLSPRSKTQTMLALVGEKCFGGNRATTKTTWGDATSLVLQVQHRTSAGPPSFSSNQSCTLLGMGQSCFECQETAWAVHVGIFQRFVEDSPREYSKPTREYTWSPQPRSTRSCDKPASTRSKNATRGSWHRF